MDCLYARFSNQKNRQRKKNQQQHRRRTNTRTALIHAHTCLTFSIFQFDLHAARTVSCLVNALPKTKFCYAYKCFFVRDRSQSTFLRCICVCVRTFFFCSFAFNAFYCFAVCFNIFSLRTYHQLRIYTETSEKKLSIA